MSAVETDIAERLARADLLFKNHWLSHAACLLKAVVEEAPDDGEARALAAATDRRLSDPSALDLSRRHQPIFINVKTRAIVSTLQFRYLTDPAEKREAFRQAVNYIDLETSSQCNRRCSYCPNSQNDRLSGNRFMDDDVFRSIIHDLSQIDYSRDLHFVGYNEPMMHSENLTARVAFARSRLPHAHLVVFTNGDYLDRERLEALRTAGVSSLTVSAHLAPGEEYSDARVFDRINKMLSRLEMTVTPIAYIPDRHIKVRLNAPGMDVSITHSDYAHHGSNRASTLDGVGPEVSERAAACWRPLHQFIIGNLGDVVPCCVMVSDDPRNAGNILGRADGKTSIFDIYGGRKHLAWRRGLFTAEPKSGACARCAEGISGSVECDAAFYSQWGPWVRDELIDPAAGHAGDPIHAP